MDRDIVNALHHLYQNGPVDWPLLEQKLWCGPDSKPTLTGFGRIAGPILELTDELVRFLKAVEDQMANMPKPDFVFSFPFAQSIRKQGELRPCFVAMPYGLDGFDAMKQTIIKSALAAGFEAEVSIDLKTPGSITDQIWHGIRRADVVMVDVTKNNPNVFYELGLAHALGKEVIVITQNVAKVPFDIKTLRLLSYDPRDLSRLETDLTNAFKSVTARYKHEGPEPRF